MPTKPGLAVLAQVMAVHHPAPPLLGLLRGLMAQDHAPRIIRVLPAAHLEHHRLLGAGERVRVLAAVDGERGAEASADLVGMTGVSTGSGATTAGSSMGSMGSGTSTTGSSPTASGANACTKMRRGSV